MSRGFRLARENVCVGPPTPLIGSMYVGENLWITLLSNCYTTTACRVEVCQRSCLLLSHQIKLV